MANPILIGVGGTGQTVLASYLRLAELAGFTPAPFYILDSDMKCPLSETLTKLKSRVKQTVGGTMPSRWKIDPFPTTHIGRKTFGALFGTLSGDRRELFNCLFSEEGEQTLIHHGMYGRPSIGATSIRYKILSDDDDLKELRNTLKGGEKHIVLIGSCFGGTGSGGVPILASELFKLKADYNLEVDALTFLPWFKLVLREGISGDDEKSLHDHLNNSFEANAASGIFYFKDRIKHCVRSLMLIGVEDHGRIERISNEKRQEETAHIINLLAAILIQNHITGNTRWPKGISGYWYEEATGIDPGTTLIYRNNNSHPISLLDVIKRAFLRKDWLAILKKFFENYHLINNDHKPVFLNIVIERLKGATKTESQVLSEITTYLGELQEIINEGYNWLLQIKDPIFFRLQPEDERIHSQEYEKTSHDPLSAISKFCDRVELTEKFVESDFSTSEKFCDKFTCLFLENLTKAFKL